MAISGAGFVLFLLFHGAMNFVSILSPEGYDAICNFLGANWYAVVGTIGLAVLLVIHILCGILLTVENLLARGFVRYKRKERPKAHFRFALQDVFSGILLRIMFLMFLQD